MNGNGKDPYRDSPQMSDEERRRRAQVRGKLAGNQGYGEQAFDEDDAAVLEAELKNLYNSAQRGLDEKTSLLIAGVGRHIQKGTFRGIARRRGGVWRLISSLADRVNQFEALALIYVSGAAAGTDLVKYAPILAYDTHLHLDTVEQTAARLGSPKTQEAMERLIDQLRDLVEKITMDMVRDYHDDFRERMRGGPEW